jgi:fructose-1,6-bisphosphatase/inositol monophosphatase family enzyme
MRAASSFLDITRPLAVRAAERIIALRQSPLIRQRKPDRSLVTNADHEADRILRAGLRKAFPDHAILTEESGLDGPADAEYMWVIDPLDGTSAYADGKPGYSVMVGLLKQGNPFAGVVVDPIEGHIFEAVRGKGAFHTLRNVRHRVQVSTRSDLSQMPVITSSDFPRGWEEMLRRDLRGPWIPELISVGIKVGHLVRELADIYINHHAVHYWDTCAPQIILEEAGGMFTFWDGKPVDYPLGKKTYRHAGPTLATNGVRHREILAALRRLS